MNNLKFYLTSIEPNIQQTIYSQSIGGYISNSLLYPETTLASNVGLYDNSLQLNVPDGGWGDWSDIKYLNIGREIIKIDEIGEDVNIEERAVNSILNMHIVSDIVRGISDNNTLFNDVFNDEYKQYRCLAVKNIFDNNDEYVDNIINGVNIYIDTKSSNPNSSFKIAIEIPKNQFMNGYSTDWTSSSLIDNSLQGLYSDNYFQNSNLKIKEGPNKGQERIIISYDGDTGTFIFNDSLPYDNSDEYNNNLFYEIDPSPSQRLISGTVSPFTNMDNITDFKNVNEDVPLYIDINNNSDSLNLNDVFYIWIERAIKKGSKEFLNSFGITINYNIGT